MKKLVAVLLALVLCVGAFAGCSYATVEEKKEEKTVSSMFVRIEQTGSWQIVYHKETRVMYAVSIGGYNSGNFTVMVNPDGTPQVWNGE